LKLRHYLFTFSIALGAVVMMSSCAPKKKLKIEEKPKEEVQASPTPEALPTPIPEAPGLKITQEWTDVPALEIVHFEFDSAQLDQTARAALEEKCGCA